MYLFKTLKSLSKYSKQLTRSSQQLNAVPHQTISHNLNTQDMKDYFKLLQIDTSVLTTDEIRIVNDWYNNNKTEDCSISLRSLHTQEAYHAFSKENKELLSDFCILWEDEESNYAGICIKGIMRGKIVFISHDNQHPIPVFRNIDSFLKAVKSNRITDLYPPQVEYLSATNNPFDYPSINRTSLELKQDSSAADILWNKAATEKDDAMINTILSFIQIATLQQIPKLKQYIFDDTLMGDILGIYKFYGYKEDANVLLQIGKENKHFRKILKELGATPQKILWIEKW
jgi:hypothetical protein